MANSFSYFSTKAQDWQATSYGDIGVCAGYGGGLKHLKLWSPSQNLKVNSLIVHGSVGQELEIKSEFLNLVNGVIQYTIKSKDSVVSEWNYKPVKCLKSFSITDYVGSICTGAEESAAFIAGLKVGGLAVTNPNIGNLFIIPPEVETSWGLGAGMTAFSGVVIGVGIQFFDYNMQQRYLREKARKSAMDPVIRDPGY